MAQDLFEYDKMVERALRGVVRDALRRAAREGLRGAHHFYIGFATGLPGVVIPEHLRASHWRGFEAAIAKGTMKLQGRPTLTRALHKSGRKLYVEMTFALVKDEAEGEVLGSVAMARDVTDRVERERAPTRAS